MQTKKSNAKKRNDSEHDKITKALIFRKVLLIVVAVALYSAVTDFLIGDLIVGRWLKLYDNFGEGPAMLASYILAFLLLLSMVFLFRKKSVLEFSLRKFSNGLHVGLIPLALACLFGVVGVYSSLTSGMEWTSPLRAITMSFAIILGVGVTEELLFRGLVQNLLFDIFGRKTRKAVTLTVIITGVLFGAWHLLNITAEGANWSFVAMQSLIVSGIGMVLAAFYARSNSIWAVALIHGLWDFGLMIADVWFATDAELLHFSAMEGVPVVIALLLGLVPCSICVAYSMFLLRNKKKKEYLIK